MVARKHLGNWNRGLRMLEQGFADVLMLGGSVLISPQVSVL